MTSPSPEFCVACGTNFNIGSEKQKNVYIGEIYLKKFIQCLRLESQVKNLDEASTIAFCRQCKTGLEQWCKNQRKVSDLNAEISELNAISDGIHQKVVTRIMKLGQPEESQSVRTRNSGRNTPKRQSPRASCGRGALDSTTRLRNLVYKEYGNKLKDGKLVKESDGGISLNRPIKREAEDGDDDDEEDRPSSKKKFSGVVPVRMDCGIQTVGGKVEPKETQTEPPEQKNKRCQTPIVSLDSNSTQTKGFKGVNSSCQTVLDQEDRGIQVKIGSQVSDGTQTVLVKLSDTGIQTTENRVNESVTTVAIPGGTPQSASTPNRRSLIKEVGPGKFIFQDKIPFELIQGIYKCGSCSSILSRQVMDVVKHIRQNHFEDLVKVENPECAKPVALPCNRADNNQEVKHTENLNSSMIVVEPLCNNVSQASMTTNQITATSETTKTEIAPRVTKKEMKKFIYRNQPFDFMDGQFTCSVCSNSFTGDIASAKKYILQHIRKYHRTKKFLPSRPASNIGLVPRSSQASVCNSTLKRTGLSTFRYRDKVSFKFVRSSFVCSLCPVGEGTFWTKSGMIQHIKRKHEDESLDQSVETREEVSTRPVAEDEENCMILEPFVTSPKPVVSPDREDFIVVERLDAVPRRDSVSDVPLIELDDSPPPSVGEPDSDGTVSLDGDSNSQGYTSPTHPSGEQDRFQPSEDTTSGVQVTEVQNVQEDEDDDIMIIEVRPGGFSVTNAQKNPEKSAAVRPRSSANVIQREQKEPLAPVQPPSSTVVNAQQNAQYSVPVRPPSSAAVSAQQNAQHSIPVQPRSSSMIQQNGENPMQVGTPTTSNLNTPQNGHNSVAARPQSSSVLNRRKSVPNSTPLRPRSSSVVNAVLNALNPAQARPRSSPVPYAGQNPQASPQVQPRCSSVVQSGQHAQDSSQARSRSSSIVSLPPGSPEPQVRRRSLSVVNNVEQNTQASEKEQEELSEPEEIDEEEEDTLIAEGPGKYRYGRCGVHLAFDKYVCRICYEVFVLPRGAEELKMHIQTAHKEAAPKFYRHVEETGPGVFLYRKKVAFKKLGSDFTCGVCRGILEKKYDIIKHILLVHRDLLLKEGGSHPWNEQVNGGSSAARAPEETEDIKPDDVVLFENRNRRITRLSSKENPGKANARVQNGPQLSSSIQNNPEVSVLDDGPTDKTAVEEDFRVVRKIGPNKYLYLEECPFSEKSGVVQCGVCDYQHRNTRNAQTIVLRHMREKHMDPRILRETGNNTWIFKDRFEFKAMGSRFKCGICGVNQGTMTRILTHLLTNHKDTTAKPVDENNSCESAAAVDNPPDQAASLPQMESSDCPKLSDEQPAHQEDIPSPIKAVISSPKTVQTESHQTLCSICGFIGSFFDFFRHMKSVHGSHGDEQSKMGTAPVNAPPSAPGTAPVSNGDPGLDGSATSVDPAYCMTTPASATSLNSDSNTDVQEPLLSANPFWSSVSLTCPSRTRTVETPISEDTTPVIQDPAADYASGKFPCRICSLELPSFQEYGKHVRVHLREHAF